MRIITLTTDFGLGDWFVGTMKGVIAGLAPQTHVIDITHDVPAGEVRAGAFALAAAYRFFPKGTIHVAVVDPGVGTKRKAVAVQTADHCFVGPDNGVLSWALRGEKVKSVRVLENRALFLRPLSQTFHGRDIFAPVAAYLSRGLSTKELGPVVKDFVRLPWPEPRRRPGRTEGEVIYIDRFGNAITNLPVDGSAECASCEILGKRRVVCPLKTSYQSVSSGRPVVVPGSSGFLEVAINGGAAAKLLGLKIGSRISYQPPASH